MSCSSPVNCLTNHLIFNKIKPYQFTNDNPLQTVHSTRCASLELLNSLFRHDHFTYPKAVVILPWLSLRNILELSCRNAITIYLLCRIYNRNYKTWLTNRLLLRHRHRKQRNKTTQGMRSNCLNKVLILGDRMGQSI